MFGIPSYLKARLPLARKLDTNNAFMQFWDGLPSAGKLILKTGPSPKSGWTRPSPIQLVRLMSANPYPHI